MIGPCGVPFLRSHRKVRSSDKASANTMHKVGIKTSHIMDFVAQQSGGYESVGYTQKDLYNHFTAQRNIEVADGDAEGDFEKCMSMSTEEEFEVAWKNLLDDYSLHQNKWAVDVYKKKTLWAEAYLRGIFFAGAKSTQRVEGMNAYMNRFLKLRLKLFEFVQSFDRALAKLRHNEAKVQVESVNSTPVLSTCMKRIEKHAADTYTRGIFNKFLKEIKKEQSLFKVDKVEFEDFRVYYLSRYQQPDAAWSVNYQPNDGIMKCSCLKFESIGFPCQHMISVMKMEHMREIPSCLILQRWTKTAKSFPLQGSTSMPEWVTQTTRFGALSSACVEMCYYASHITKGYNETKEEITKLTSRMRELYVLHVEEEQRNMRENDNVEGISMHFGVGDPVTIKVYALKAVGDEAETDGLDNLLDVFESMVGDQRRCMNERLSQISLS
ncbi:hypothetical protein RHMOL_Rhmol01G0101800 [Rhododendron molle]|uniref:Uncharacterized protein n=1 Tax=Rhododendron molle TaxID=49168 RepID=A0ACC0PZM4_RHOML|nr:hypothetical protein RHMOL_Rhmol01G0101800 [Rhododendron molle]